MGTGTTERRTADIRRFVALDDEGTGLRATWRPARGFVNLSVWRDEHCVETFHLAPAEAGRLIGFLAESLTADTPPPRAAAVRLVDDSAGDDTTRSHALRSGAQRVGRSVTAGRRRLGAGLGSVARRLGS